MIIPHFVVYHDVEESNLFWLFEKMVYIWYCDDSRSRSFSFSFVGCQKWFCQSWKAYECWTIFPCHAHKFNGENIFLISSVLVFHKRFLVILVTNTSPILLNWCCHGSSVPKNYFSIQLSQNTGYYFIAFFCFNKKCCLFIVGYWRVARSFD